MSATDVAPVVARLVDRIRTVTDIGLVHPAPVWDQDDLRPYLVDSGVLRAWWIAGPRLDQADRVVQHTAGYQERWWVYTIEGVEGIADGTSSIETLRAKALAVADAIDADPTLAGTCHESRPCTWQEPEYANTPIAVVARVVITKRVLTLSTPT